MDTNKFKELEQIINYEFDDINLLIFALNGSKVTNSKGKNNKTLKNESLAQFGDALLSLAVVEYYYDQHCDKENIQNKLKEYTLNDNLIQIRERINLKNYIHNGYFFWNDAPQNLKPSFNNKNEPYIEAIIGAIYKDSGFEEVKKWIINFFGIKK